MGLERLTCVVQNARSVYDTDLFSPVMDRVDEIITRATGSAGERPERGDWRKRSSRTTRARRRSCDGRHLPGEHRPRLRPAPDHPPRLHLRLPLRVKGTFLHEIVPVVIDKMSPGYPALREKQE